MAFLLCVTVAPAQSEPTTTAAAEPATAHRIEDIVVTGTRTEYSVDEAPVPVQVISREEIEAVSAVNIAEALDRIPGIYVQQNETFLLGANTVRMQGADANKVAIVRNGRRFRGGVNGVVDLRDIAIEDVERIEIVRGPASSLYGSDAMGGVINIITRHGRKDPHVSLTSAGGNFGAFLFQASHGWQVGPFAYFLSYQHDEIQLAQLYGIGSEQYSGENADEKQVRDDVSLQLDYLPAPEHRVELSADYNPIREGPQSQRQNITVGGDWDWTFSQLWDTELGATWYGFRRENELEDFGEHVDYNDYSAEARVFRTVQRGWFAESHLITVGNRFRIETIDSRGAVLVAPDGMFETPDVNQSAWLESPYLQDEILLTESISSVIGTSIDIHEAYGADVSPRFSLSWRPAHNYRITGIVGRGYRAPDLLQLYSADYNNGPGGYVILGNPDLNPETDLGFNLQFDFKPIPGIEGFVTLFQHNFRDLIQVDFLCAPPSVPCPPNLPMPLPPLVLQYENIAKARTRGVELTVTAIPSDMAWWPFAAHRLRLDLSYAYLDSEDLSGRAGFDGDELPFRPPNRFLPAATYEYEPRDVVLQVWGEYADRSYADLPNSTVIPAYWLWNFKLSTLLGGAVPWTHRSPALGEIADHLTVFLEGKNVFDEAVGVLGPVGLSVSAVGRRTLLAGVQFEL